MVGPRGRGGHPVTTIVIAPVKDTATIQETWSLVEETSMNTELKNRVKSVLPVYARVNNGYQLNWINYYEYE